MPKPDAMNKDFSQVLRESYDPSLERIRVESVVTDGTDTVAVNADGSVNVVASNSSRRGTLTDRSGVAGIESTTLMAANASRNYLLIQNVSAGTIWINFTTAAAAASPSIKLVAGETFTMENAFVSTEAVTVIREGASDLVYVAKEG